MPTVLRIVNLITPTSLVYTHLTTRMLLYIALHAVKRKLCSTCCRVLCIFHTRPDYVTTHTMRKKHTYFTRTLPYIQYDTIAHAMLYMLFYTY